jgi:large subunit ribosomal protein L13
MKTYSLKAKDITEKWHVVDAADQSLGRVATRIASLLRGKHRPDFTPNLDMRDFVVVVNAERVRISGNNKMRQKLYRHHSQYPGGLKEVTLEKMLARHPTRVIEHAVRGMLPHNRLGAKLRRHLHVYVGPEHPHAAQTGGAPKKAKVAVAEKTAPVEEPEAVVEETPEVVAQEPVESVAEEAPEAAIEESPEPAAEELTETTSGEEPSEEAPPEATSAGAQEES